MKNISNKLFVTFISISVICGSSFVSNCNGRISDNDEGSTSQDDSLIIEDSTAYRDDLCGGYTQQHDLSDEDWALFHKVMGEDKFTPLSVASQVVAGYNYRFRCRYDDGTESSPGYCLVTIHQPLQGESVILAIKDENAGPEMKVIIDDNGKVGRYIDEDETSYHGIIQDDYLVEKSKARTETVKAVDGQGWLYLKMYSGNKNVLRLPDSGADVIGTMIHEKGEMPEVYRCLGYIKGWFLVEVDGKAGFVCEDLVIWDGVLSF